MPGRVAIVGVPALAAVLGTVLLIGSAGCRRSSTPVEVYAAGGLRFSALELEQHAAAERVQRLDLADTAGPGIGVVDLDGDDRPDLVAPNCVSVGSETLRECRVYRNRGSFRFEDVTKGSGLAEIEDVVGVAAADLDGDGRSDLLLTGPKGTRFLKNIGGFRFRERTREAGLAMSGWTTAVAFGDWDRDNRLDLYVARYVRHEAPVPRFSVLGQSSEGGEHVIGATPAYVYPSIAGTLFRNLGSGRFAAAGAAVGLDGCGGATLGALFADLDGDRWPDLYLANDFHPAELYLNRQGRRFERLNSSFAPAYGRDGETLSLRGVDLADFNADGRMDLVAAGGERQGIQYFRQFEQGRFREEGRSRGLGLPSRRFNTSGIAAGDLDNDGYADVMTCAGSWNSNEDRLGPSPGWRQPLRLFRNLEGRHFESFVPADSGGRELRMAGRGLAIADLDGDGKLDGVVGRIDAPPLILRNETPAKGHWLTVQLKGHAGNSEGIGARVTLYTGRGKQVRDVRSSHSYLSSSPATPHFGVAADGVMKVSIEWPCGADQNVPVTQLDGVLRVSQPSR